MTRPRFLGSLAALILMAALSACGSQSRETASASIAAGTHSAQSRATTAAPAPAPAARSGAVPSGTWPTFDDNAQRTGVGPADSGITAGTLGSLKRTTVHLDGTVDASVIEIAGARIAGHRHDVVVLTTDYGRTEALDASTGRRLWEFAPASVAKLTGTAQITTATPLLDPDHRYIYAASPDGYVHKLSLSNGHQVWSTAITHLPSHEKIAGALNLDGSELVAEIDGYNGDTPPYVGHVVTMNPANGHVTHVFNSLCSNIKSIMSSPAICRHSDSAIWGRPGAIIEPGSHNILVSTSNGDFNGHTDWGDSVLELSPSLKLLHNWTPADQDKLNVDDLDLGSTEPALLPVRGHLRLAVQGGKDGILRLLNLSRLNGTHGGPGPRTGGELQRINAPGPTDVFSQPAVWRSLVFVADGAGTAAYRYGSDNRLHELWHNADAGTSPIVSGGLLYVYDEQSGVLEVLNPNTGHVEKSLAAGPGHWNSPTVIGGCIYLPVGNDNEHASTGTMYIWARR